MVHPGRVASKPRIGVARYIGVQYAATVANGTEVLELTLRSLGSGAGDEVIMVANAGMYASTATRRTGALPVFADVDKRSMNLDINALQQLLRPGHARGHSDPSLGPSGQHRADRRALPGGLASPSSRTAQRHGASRSGRRAGAFGLMGYFSFYPTKNLGALGDAGAIVTDDDGIVSTLAQAIRLARQVRRPTPEGN